ncbi:UDP-2,3-diacylglucosamine diphosphatase [Halomonas sp. Bachu 37]|uniref:UDP-2,3-diacylglucosamine diphosphatase n=1 Tax=Halomonas kashgarensis TaxID=3084920 RepID=UPI0032177EDA
MHTLLIADLHLDTTTPDITQGFLRYLEHTASGAEALLILGDLFDAWIGDDLLDLQDDPKAELARQVIEALEKLTHQDTKLYFMHGNRDFLLGERFIQACNGTLLAEPAELELEGTPLVVLHGDSLCTRDEAYMQFRQQARDPAWQAQILALPIEQRLELAKSLRLQSGEANANKADAIMDVTPAEVERCMSEHGVVTMIHGHTHRPYVHDLTMEGVPAKRYVLGDWDNEHGWDIVLDDAIAHPEPRLRQFPLHSPPDPAG